MRTQSRAPRLKSQPGGAALLTAAQARRVAAELQDAADRLDGMSAV